MNNERFRIGCTYISKTTPEDSIQKILQAVEGNKTTYICVSNPRTVTIASKDKEYQKIMNNSFMNLPDAEPMVWAARLWGLKDVQRTMGPLLFKRMITESQNSLKHFLLGDTQETLDSVLEVTRTKNLNIVGVLSPPFSDLDDYDYKYYADRINESKADIVWLALRAPKQDFFAAKLLPYLDKKVCIGVGAAFRFFIGEYKLAPLIIRKFGLMGLYWGKKNQKYIPFIVGYLKDNVPFIYYLLKIPFWRLSGRKYYE